jgi:hypothetical protein
MQAMADLPFSIYTTKGDKELDNSDDYRNALGFMPSPSRFFALSEGALCLAGQAYWFKGTGVKTGKVKELTYWRPDSVTLNKDAAKKGEIVFERTGTTQKYTGDEVLYMWGLDPMVEIGAPSVYPFKAALTAATANGAITQWVADYMQRGAIKAMMLMVDGMPPPSEVERMESWFNRFMRGSRNMAWKVFNSSGVKPTIIGDGLEALRDLSINSDLRYEIHQALGTRHLLEDSNYATAVERRISFYENVIMPDARVMQNDLNDQILHAMGFHLEFEPERMEVFQDNEQEQVAAFGALLDVFMKGLPFEVAFQLAAEKLDYQFTDEQKALIAASFVKEEKPKEEPPVEVVQPEEQMPINKAVVELDKWEKKNKAAGKPVTWHAVNIPDEIVKAVNGGMSFDEARELARAEPKDNSEALKALAAAINNAVKVDPQPIINVTMPAVNLTAQMPPNGTVTVNVPEQPAPVVNMSPVINVEQPAINPPAVNIAPATVNVENKVNVQPADVIIPAMPTEATITTDSKGNKTLKVKK